jgi:E3 ubiquitin-protein ligase MYCBP2
MMFKLIIGYIILFVLPVLTDLLYYMSQLFIFLILKENFEALLKLLEWSWNTFHSIAQDLDTSRGSSHLGAITDLQKLVYISRACLRLLKTYINEVYPDGGKIYSVYIDLNLLV